MRTSQPVVRDQENGIDRGQKIREMLNRTFWMFSRRKAANLPTTPIGIAGPLRDMMVCS